MVETFRCHWSFDPFSRESQSKVRGSWASPGPFSTLYLRLGPAAQHRGRLWWLLPRRASTSPQLCSCPCVVPVPASRIWAGSVICLLPIGCGKSYMTSKAIKSSLVASALVFWKSLWELQAALQKSDSPEAAMRERPGFRRSRRPSLLSPAFWLPP